MEQTVEIDNTWSLWPKGFRNRLVVSTSVVTSYAAQVTQGPLDHNGKGVRVCASGKEGDYGFTAPTYLSFPRCHRLSRTRRTMYASGVTVTRLERQTAQLKLRQLIGIKTLSVTAWPWTWKMKSWIGFKC